MDNIDQNRQRTTPDQNRQRTTPEPESTNRSSFQENVIAGAISGIIADTVNDSLKNLINTATKESDHTSERIVQNELRYYNNNKILPLKKPHQESRFVLIKTKPIPEYVSNSVMDIENVGIWISESLDGERTDRLANAYFRSVTVNYKLSNGEFRDYKILGVNGGWAVSLKNNLLQLTYNEQFNLHKNLIGFNICLEVRKFSPSSRISTSITSEIIDSNNIAHQLNKESKYTITVI